MKQYLRHKNRLSITAQAILFYVLLNLVDSKIRSGSQLRFERYHS